MLPTLTIIVQKYEVRAMHLEIEAEVNRTRNLLPRHKPPSWSVPFDRNPRYVDREILEKLKGQLCSGTGSSTAAIYGLGGVGKTQIALELAYQIREECPDYSIFWLPSMDLKSIQQSYLNMATQLGVMAATREPDEAMKSVCNHLCQSSSGPWLLIFDNADDLSMWHESASGVNIRAYLPSSLLGRILFTTRCNRVAQLLAPGSTIHVPEMGAKQATRVLESLLIDKDLLEDRESTTELLEQLTYLPLAIAQAASFINQNSTDIKGYITLLNGQEQDAVDLLSEDFEDRERYKSIRNPVATTWLTSFDQMQKQDSLAAEYLSFMACLCPREIPISILPYSNAVEQQRAIGLLRAYGFVRSRPDGHSLDMHRLVHLAMRNFLRSSGRLYEWEQKVLQVLCEKWPDADPRFRRQWQQYLPHAFHILETTTTEKATGMCADLRWNISFSLFFDGRRQEGIRAIHQVINYKKATLGPEHLDTLRVSEGLIMFYDPQHDIEKARELNTQILQVRLKVLGPDSPDVAISLGSLAQVYERLGHYQVAEWLCISAIKGRLKHFGIESRHTRSVITVMINTYLGQGRLADAAELAASHHALTVRVCGADSQDALSSQAILSVIYIQQGHWKEAESQSAESLLKHRKLLGSHHPLTISCAYQLATIMSKQGRYTEGAALVINTAHELEHLYGPGHPIVRDAYGKVKEYKDPKYAHCALRP